MLMTKAETLRADGQTWAATAEQLGVCQSLLFRWRRESTGEAFKAVVVTPDTSVEAPSTISARDPARNRSRRDLLLPDRKRQTQRPQSGRLPAHRCPGASQRATGAAAARSCRRINVVRSLVPRVLIGAVGHSTQDGPRRACTYRLLRHHFPTVAGHLAWCAATARIERPEPALARLGRLSKHEFSYAKVQNVCADSAPRNDGVVRVGVSRAATTFGASSARSHGCSRINHAGEKSHAKV